MRHHEDLVAAYVEIFGDVHQGQRDLISLEVDPDIETPRPPYA